jgi:hypothetical protein
MFSLYHATSQRLKAYSDTTMPPMQLRRWRTDVLKATQAVAAKQIECSISDLPAGSDTVRQGWRSQIGSADL